MSVKLPARSSGQPSSLVEVELKKLENIQDNLAESLDAYNSNEYGEAKGKILILISNYEEKLNFVMAEVEFQYDVDLKNPLVNHDPVLLRLALKIDKANDFFQNFRVNFEKKQRQIKAEQTKKFQDLKDSKYKTQDKDTSTIQSRDQPTDADARLEDASTDTKILTTTKKISSKLIQSSQILQSSLVQSQLNLEDLETQSDSLANLSDKYGRMKSILEKSDSFIKDIKLSSERDKKRMYYALLFFGFCVLRVFWRRLLKLPVMFVLRTVLYMIKIACFTTGLMSSSKKSVTSVDFLASEVQSLTSTGATDTTLTKPSLSVHVPDIQSTAVNINEEDDLSDALERIIDEL